MKLVTINQSINQPDISDYNSSYPKMPCNTENKEILFGIITQPKNIVSALIIAETTGNSPVSFYEKQIQSAINSGEIATLNPHEKQFVGTATCVVMESNGWEKTGKKQRYSKGIFTSAEIYEKTTT